MLNAFTRISAWGVTPEMSPSFAKKIILTNRLGLLFAVNMSVSAIAFVIFKQYGLALFTFFFVLTEFSWPLFNFIHRYNISRVGLLISSNVLGFMVSVMLPESRYNRGFYVMIGIPILIFSLKERAFISLGVAIPLLLYPISEIVPLYIPVLELSPEVASFIFYAIGIVYLILIFIMFLFLASENERAEEKLEGALRKVEDEKQRIVRLNEQLEEQRMRAFSSAKFAALGEMASGIAHEINNPMTIIDLNSEQIRHLIQSDPIETGAITDKITLISRTVHRIARIIDSMRSFSRPGDQDPLEFEPIQKIIEETLIFCRERFKNHHIQLTVHFPRHELLVYCRAVQMSQVLLNLLNNAFDAVEPLAEKWVMLEVVEEKGRVMISVIDSGTGIPVKDQEKIFDPFFTTKPPGKGTGLGLSLSRTIIEEHGGKLTLDKEAKNTRFVVELPDNF
jgi:signal transduction histidine kinase